MEEYANIFDRIYSFHFKITVNFFNVTLQGRSWSVNVMYFKAELLDHCSFQIELIEKYLKLHTCLAEPENNLLTSFLQNTSKMSHTKIKNMLRYYLISPLHSCCPADKYPHILLKYVWS